MTLTFGVLLALWVAVEDCDPAITDTGAGTGTGTGTGADTDAGAGAGTGTGADTDTDTDTDAGAGTGTNTGTDAGPESLSPHEREEAAKDELARARDAIERGDLAEAAAALERASTFDSNNPGITELREQMRKLQPDAG
jgi:hypothetical protein